MRKLLAILVVGVCAAFATAQGTSACETYENSRARFSRGDAYCGDTGPGCQECDLWSQNGGYAGSCFTTTGGATFCVSASGHVFYVY